MNNYYTFFVIMWRRKKIDPWDLEMYFGDWEVIGKVLYSSYEEAELYLYSLGKMNNLNLVQESRWVFTYENEETEETEESYYEYKILRCEQSAGTNSWRSPWTVGAIRELIDPEDLARLRLSKSIFF